MDTPGSLTGRITLGRVLPVGEPAGRTSASGPKIAIVGYGRHGKDTVGKIFSKITSLRYGGSTSWAALPYVADHLGIHPQLAWETRHDNRQFWKDYCDWLRRDDPCFLIRKVLFRGDMVVGIRDKVELEAMREQKLVDLIIWVDANPRITTVDHTVTFGPGDCDQMINNNGSVDSLVLECCRVARNRRLGLLYPGVYDNIDDYRRLVNAPTALGFCAPTNEETKL
jgi:hypothetical protein